MVILKKIIFLLYTFGLISSASAHIFDEVKVECVNIKNCKNYEDIFMSIVGKEISTAELRSKVRLLSHDPFIKYFSYQIIQHDENFSKKLNLYIKKKIRIGKIKIHITSEEMQGHLVNIEQIKQLLPIREGALSNKRNESLVINILSKYLSERGISQKEISIEKEVVNRKINYQIKIYIVSFIRISEIVLDVDGSFREEHLYFSELIKNHKNKNWDKLKLKLEIDSIASLLHEDGYYFSKIIQTVEKKSGNTVVLKLKISIGPQISLGFRGNVRFSKQELMKVLKGQFKRDTSKINEQGIRSVLEKTYIDNGIYKSKIRIREETGKTIFNDKYRFFFVVIEEGNKIEISKLKFDGLITFSEKKILEIYYDKSNSIVNRGFLDEDYLDEFSDKVKALYLNNGFLFFNISKPRITFSKNGKQAIVQFIFNEFKKTLIRENNIYGIGENLSNIIKKNIINKANGAFQPLGLEKDIEKILEGVKEEGYYYAKFKSLDEKDILSYNKDYSRVTINLKVLTNKKTILKNIIYTGHETTKRFVIEREVLLARGDLITPNKVLDLQNRLNILGLFSNVKITPVIDNNNNIENTNLLIHLIEKDFGVGEVSLGYRTDTGIRSAIGINYNNLFGRNWILASKLEGNYRLNLSSLDERREADGNKFIEWNANIGILFPYIGKTPITTEFSTTYKKQRYTSLDAKILTLKMKNTYDFNKHISFSLKYQLDTVDQFDASNASSSDDFQIGSYTFGLSLDLRDSHINPRNGSYFGVNWELANPSLGSNNDEELVVNFDKIISRNKFYYSFSPDYGLALSVSLGKEINNADDGAGFIPSIRVFRLDGQDGVRGFSDTEINLLSSGQDISSIIVDGEAFFFNAKFEVRNFINDLMIAGLFFDAGRIYINHFQPLDLRTSFGATFKFVTPVGSLDFDYGVKFRRMITNTEEESFGRFQLSIGFF